jgi:hypothetical protein
LFTAAGKLTIEKALVFLKLKEEEKKKPISSKVWLLMKNIYGLASLHIGMGVCYGAKTIDSGLDYLNGKTKKIALTAEDSLDEYNRRLALKMKQARERSRPTGGFFTRFFKKELIYEEAFIKDLKVIAEAVDKNQYTDNEINELISVRGSMMREDYNWSSGYVKRWKKHYFYDATAQKNFTYDEVIISSDAFEKYVNYPFIIEYIHETKYKTVPENR